MEKIKQDRAFLEEIDENYYILKTIAERPTDIQQYIEIENYSMAYSLYAEAQTWKSSPSKVIQQVVAKCEKVINDLEKMLYDKFLHEIPLISAIEYVGILRKIDNSDISLKYLRMKHKYLRQSLQGINFTETEYFHTSRRIIFDTITQYESLFGHNYEITDFILKFLTEFEKEFLKHKDQSSDLDSLCSSATMFTQSLAKLGYDFTAVLNSMKG